MQHPRRRDALTRQVGRRHPARRRAGAHEVEVVAGRVVGDEVDGGEGAPIGADAARIDAFFGPERAQHPAVAVVANGREVAGVSTLARRRDREVRGVAAEALQPQAPVGLAALVELDHRFAERKELDRGVWGGG